MSGSDDGYKQPPSQPADTTNKTLAEIAQQLVALSARLMSLEGQ
jgi:hypothetical protein